MSKNVIEVGDFSVLRKNSKYTHLPDKACRHFNLEIDENGHIVDCLDCGKQIGALFALELMLDSIQKSQKEIAAKSLELAQLKSEGLHLIAARKVEKVWRTRDMLPCCPHCGVGISKEDGLGDSCVNKAFSRKPLPKQ